jgi:hypothetical protein
LYGSGSETGSITGWTGGQGSGPSGGFGGAAGSANRYSDAPDERRSMDSASRFGTIASEDVRNRTKEGEMMGGYDRS